MYFLVRWLSIAIVRSFFKEVAVLHPERIPLYGPAIFVGNHNNQFMDATMLVANIPRQLRFLVAMKSMKRHVIGLLSRLAGGIPVVRQEDLAVRGEGSVRISHHFTSASHLCPLPPHHHHYHRGGDATGDKAGRSSSSRSVSPSPFAVARDYVVPEKDVEENAEEATRRTATRRRRNEGGEVQHEHSQQQTTTTLSSLQQPPRGILRQDTAAVADDREPRSETAGPAAAKKEQQDTEAARSSSRDETQSAAAAASTTQGEAAEEAEGKGISSWWRAVRSPKQRSVDAAAANVAAAADKIAEFDADASLGTAAAAVKRETLAAAPAARPPQDKDTGEEGNQLLAAAAARLRPVTAAPPEEGTSLLSILGCKTRFLRDCSVGCKLLIEKQHFNVVKVLSDTHVLVTAVEGETQHHGPGAAATAAVPLDRERAAAAAAVPLDRERAAAAVPLGRERAAAAGGDDGRRAWEGGDRVQRRRSSSGERRDDVARRRTLLLRREDASSSSKSRSKSARSASDLRAAAAAGVSAAAAAELRVVAVGGGAAERDAERAKEREEERRVARGFRGERGDVVGVSPRASAAGLEEQQQQQQTSSFQELSAAAAVAAKRSLLLSSEENFTNSRHTALSRAAAERSCDAQALAPRRSSSSESSARGDGSVSRSSSSSSESSASGDGSVSRSSSSSSESSTSGDGSRRRSSSSSSMLAREDSAGEGEEAEAETTFAHSSFSFPFVQRRGDKTAAEEGRDSGGTLRRRRGRDALKAEETAPAAADTSSNKFVSGEEEKEKRTAAAATHLEHHVQERHHHHHYRGGSSAIYKPYKILPRVDQRKVYEEVSRSLIEGDCIGIFPEGGSHDRTTLLPLKAGVAIMALQGLAAGAEDVMIVPVGLIYHNPHKTQSRATVCIGNPIAISRELAVEYERNRRAATAQILSDVEQGMRSCIITAQDHETIMLIKLSCSLYPPERLRLSSEKYFNLNQLLSKLFWRCADEPELLRLRQGLVQYQGSLARAGIPDHDVWMLKQSTAGASLFFAEKLIALIYSIAFGIPLLPLWGPLRVIARILAEGHRTKALAASSVKVKATDVVASYKVIVLLVCVPLFNILYGALLGFFFLHSWKETLVTILLCVCLLPVSYYISMRRAERILPLMRQMRTLIMVLVGKVNVWRENERELVTERTEMQLCVRDTLFHLGPRTSPTFIDELHAIVPKAVLDADTKRLVRKKEDFAPLQMKYLLNNAEEIL